MKGTNDQIISLPVPLSLERIQLKSLLVKVLADMLLSRNNVSKPEKFRFRKETQRNYFSNRVVDKWNGLSNYIVSVETMKSFKKIT